MLYRVWPRELAEVEGVFVDFDLGALELSCGEGEEAGQQGCGNRHVSLWLHREGWGGPG